MFKIAITGHRPAKFVNYNVEFGYDLLNAGWIKLGFAMREFLLSRLENNQEIECITGMALGIDQLFGLVALKLHKQNYPIRIFCALPCRNQNKTWKNDQYWQSILKQANEIHYVSEQYYSGCMQRRNIFMAERADEILAFWDGTKGGTENMVKYCHSINKPVINLFSKEQQKKLKIFKKFPEQSEINYALLTP